jgi:RimJ/RimL family protein N-acetyltransferase
MMARDTRGEAVGHIKICHIWLHLSSRLSRVPVAPDKRRRGIASRVISEALTFTFDAHHLGQADLGLSASDAVAIVCYKKLDEDQRLRVWAISRIAYREQRARVRPSSTKEPVEAIELFSGPLSDTGNEAWMTAYSERKLTAKWNVLSPLCASKWTCT